MKPKECLQKIFFTLFITIMRVDSPKILMISGMSLVLGLATIQSYISPFSDVDSRTNYVTELPKPDKIAELPQFAQKSIEWIVSVQAENGAWGAGSHARQDIHDARAVSTDPATTAFASMALLRSGNTLNEGRYKDNLKKALNYLIETVENSTEESLKITEMEGTQPQIKLGQNIDATLTVQFFLRVLPYVKNDPTFEKRISSALDKCLRKIQKAQSADGSLQGGSWAPVLQSAMATSALEQAYNQGYKVDEDKLSKARDYQKQNMDKTGNVKAERGAGVELYSVASSQRATAQEAKRAKNLIERAKATGKLEQNAPISKENLIKSQSLSEKDAEQLMDAYNQNEITISKMNDDRVLSGFGNNGGEEFLSFMMTSESLVITGGDAWNNWKNKMFGMLEKIQNQDGSWNGHHCITSPVFCTAAVILALTAENDKDILSKEKENKK
jgi:Squalene-hopene cyclase C-terminal domain